MYEKLAEYFAQKFKRGKIIEIGIGFNFKAALKLKELGFDVVVIDWNPKAVERAKEIGLNAIVDDIFNPRLEIYKQAKAMYSIRPTPEMMPYLLKLAKTIKVPIYIVPFSTDAVPIEMRLENYRELVIYKWEAKDI
ncbi:UPF0146 family protein [Thermococcus barophilus]|uniref:UPF0146 protein TBCH5v1_1908 n=1 Tax=Thermococcus barophilus TaxID=55802 RepID=A0A0S1XDH6_THEBA|nr:UPF0146 family protein [Thermococcus barophilus]ALM75814.1 hypothetical protein TBCH5v1_1908 [Thermococcus barophilus]